MKGSQAASTSRRGKSAGKNAKRPNLRALARRAAVDVSTVSRALNHDPRVNAERAQAIRALADEMGYRPRPLRSKYARSIGLLVATDDPHHLDNPFQERIALAAQRLLGDRGLHVNVECIRRGSDGDPDNPVVLPAVVKQNRVDGVLLASTPQVELVRALRELEVPVVAINDTVARLGVSCVRSDPAPAIHQAILHLAARGHQSFALLMKSVVHPTARARYDACVASLREIGIEPDPDLLITDLAGDVAGGREGIRRLVQHGTMPTAILCENDWLAMEAINELQRRGYSVPEQVSVMGHDDLWICEQMEPKLTTIHRSEEQLVSRAIDLLVGQVETGTTIVEEVLVAGEMVWRDSTGPAPQRRRDAAG